MASKATYFSMQNLAVKIIAEFRTAAAKDECIELRVNQDEAAALLAYIDSKHDEIDRLKKEHYEVCRGHALSILCLVRKLE